MWGFALCLGVSLLLNTPNIRPAPGGAAQLVVLTHALKLAALTCLGLIDMTLDRPFAGRPSWARQLGAGLAAQVASAGLFASAHAVVAQESVLVRPSRSWAFALYGALFALYGWLCLVPLVRALARHARRAEPGAIRTGLWLMTLASGAGVLWTSWALADARAVLRHGQVGLGEDLMSTLLGITVALLGVGGASATFRPDILRAPARWFRARRAFHALEPLWAALYAELPDIALPTASTGRRGHLPWPGTFDLYRRVIEIRDAYLSLRPYSRPETLDRLTAATQPTDAADPHHAAVLEAAAVAAALENRRHNRRHDTAPGTIHPTPHAPRTLDDEADWLVQVARAFAGSPEVNRIRSRVRADGG